LAKYENHKGIQQNTDDYRVHQHRSSVLHSIFTIYYSLENFS